MARPAKSTKLSNRHDTKETKANRVEFENKFTNAKGEAPEYLTENQLIIFNWLYDNLLEAQITSKLDAVSITNAAVVIDMLNAFNKDLATTPVLKYDTKFMSNYNKALTAFFRLCTELCLSPASRAKMGGIVAKNSEENKDPLLDALKVVADE